MIREWWDWFLVCSITCGFAAFVVTSVIFMYMFCIAAHIHGTLADKLTSARIRIVELARNPLLCLGL